MKLLITEYSPVPVLKHSQPILPLMGLIRYNLFF